MVEVAAAAPTVAVEADPTELVLFRVERLPRLRTPPQSNHLHYFDNGCLPSWIVFTLVLPLKVRLCRLRLLKVLDRVDKI